MADTPPGVEEVPGGYRYGVLRKDGTIEEVTTPALPTEGGAWQMAGPRDSLWVEGTTGEQMLGILRMVRTETKKAETEAAATTAGVLLLRQWKKALTTIGSMIFMSAFHNVRRLFPKQAEKLMRTIVDTYYSPPEEWTAIIAQYFERMTGQPISGDLRKMLTIEGFGGTSGSVFEAVGKTFLGPMLGLILPDPDPVEGIRPEDGQIGAERFLGVNMQFQISAWLLHVLGDMQSFGMFKSMKDLPNAISWSFGIGWLSWLVMGTPFRMCIAEPFERLINNTYRGTMLTAAQAIDSCQKGLITREDMVHTLHMYGWRDDLISVLWAKDAKDYTLADARKLFAWGVADSEWLQRYLVRQGYPEERAEVVRNLIEKNREMDLLEDVVREAENLFQDQAIDQRELERVLDEAAYTPREKELTVWRSELKRARRKFLSRADILKGVDLDIISRHDAEQILEDRGYTPADVQFIFELERKK